MMPQGDNTLTPDPAAVRADLEFMTRRWHELDQPSKIEIRAFGEGLSAHIGHFGLSDVDMAVDWIVDMNKHRNIYMVRNPIHPDTPTRNPKTGKLTGATDAHVIAAFFLWADCDDTEAAKNVHKFGGPKWTAAVTTGKIPSTRVHPYWELAEPCLNMEAWRELQTRIASHFASDPSVVNPSRIMRVAGTVSHPSSKKIAKDYVKEIVTLNNDYDDEREPIEFERALRVWPRSVAKVATLNGNGTGFDTGPAPLDREQARIRALSGDQWRNEVKGLVCSHVARGWTDAEIFAFTDTLTLSGYSVEDTRGDVAPLIAWARGKEAQKPGGGVTPQVQSDLAFDEDEIEAFPFRPWKEIDLAAIPKTEFLYKGFYARGYTSVTLAAPKVGKSLLGLVEAIDMATGRGILTGVRAEPMTAVYYNAEDDQDEINKRVSAVLSHYGIPQSEIEGRLFATSGVDLDDMFMVSGQEGIINEPIFVAIEKFILAKNADVLIFDPLQDLSRSPETNEVFRLLGQRLRRMASTCRVAIGLIHHTRKVAPGITPSIDDMRGGSALRGTSRFNRVLVSMTEEEAAKAGVDNHRAFLRVGDVESNLAPPSSEVNQWFQKLSVDAPNGQSVGVIAPWQWPDMFSGVTKEHAARVRGEIDRMASPPRQNIQADAWAGHVVANVLGLNSANKADKNRAQSILKTWIASDILRVAEEIDPRNGRPIKIVVCGSNDPLQESI